jgi:hypothetical protein
VVQGEARTTADLHRYARQDAAAGRPTSAPLARIAAAKALLERGWGRPPELAQDVPADQPILKVVREIVHVNKTPEQIAEEISGEPPLIEIGSLTARRCSAQWAM